MDTEFDPLNFQVMWSAGDKVYVQAINPVTGFGTGQSTLVDSGIARSWSLLGLPNLGNGPEWGLSQRGSELFYMKPYGTKNRILYRAYKNSSGVWVTGSLPNGTTRALPWPSWTVSDQTPGILYAIGNQATNTYSIGVRTIPENSATERIIPAIVSADVGGPRWVPGKRQVVFTLVDNDSLEQVALYDYETQQVEQITHYTAEDNVNTDETWASSPTLVWAVVNGSEFRVFEKQGDDWNEINRFNPSVLLNKPLLPYSVSPEPFDYNGQHYIMFQLANGLTGGSLSNVYITQPDATDTCHIRMVHPEDGVPSKAPEFFRLLNKEVVYFVRIENNKKVIYLAETGL